MTDETESRLLLDSIHAGVFNLSKGMRRLSTEMKMTRQHIASMVALREFDNIEVDQIKMRLDRLERKLDEGR